MQSALIVLLFGAFTETIKGQLGGGIYIAEQIASAMQGQSTEIIIPSFTYTANSSSIQVSNLNSNAMSMATSVSIVAAIISGDVDSMVGSIEGANSEDVADAFVSVAEQEDNSLNNLAGFIISVVTEDYQVLDKIIEAFQIMAQNGDCNSIYQIFTDINAQIDNEMTLAKLVEAFSSSQQVLDCATNSAAFYVPPPPSPPPPSPTGSSEPPPPGAFVPGQDKCREGSPACQWWQKKSRSLLNSNSQCQNRYVCSYFGFDSKAQCEKVCRS